MTSEPRRSFLDDLSPGGDLDFIGYPLFLIMFVLGFSFVAAPVAWLLAEWWGLFF